MTTSICVLGYGTVGQALVKKLKNYEEYNNKFKVHCVHVTDANNDKYASVTTIIEDKNHGYLRVLADGTERTEKFTAFGSDLDWLLDSNGHNIVVDCMSYNDKAVKLIFSLVKKGNKFRYIIANKKLAEGHGGDLETLAMTEGGVFNFKPAYEIGIENVVNKIYEDIVDQHKIELKSAKEEELRLSAPACGLNDTFSWDKLN